ncbi:alpha/beta fold hydrolase [Jatrophihabitans endophyticus]|uniref:alpha/beta fold hydrolase n=1 Tax=Jatrophihabitans endophyticus TaxID=1206085 RepID=UPI0019E68AF9|nr:alpha/beta fold hydrolase [Jatrophihabitans endophyticus]MBE7187202.1 alpha/beta fold hydrolase [Jatrophihabitans endophyticus]
MDTYRRGELVFDVSDTGGDGDVVVLLHGFPQNRHEWDAVTPHLSSAGYRVLAPDQRGYSPGARPAGRRSYVQSELVADVLALTDAAGVDSFHLVGHDWGALVAWAVTSRHPERVRTLTAVSVPHPKAFAWAMPRGQALKSWYMAAFQLPALPERFLPSTRGLAMLGSGGLTPEQMRAYVEPLGRDGLTGALNWYRALPWSQREKGYARRSTVPTTYVWSDGDVALGRAGAEATARFVDAPYRFAVLAGLSHWIPDEAPDDLAELILDRVRG